MTDKNFKLNTGQDIPALGLGEFMHPSLVSTFM